MAPKKITPEMPSQFILYAAYIKQELRLTHMPKKILTDIWVNYIEHSHYKKGDLIDKNLLSKIIKFQYVNPYC